MGQIPEGGRPGNTRTTQKKRGRTEGITILRCRDTVGQAALGGLGGEVGEDAGGRGR